MMKYSDLLIQWLVKRGYTHCFTVGGGNIMHLTESASRGLTVVPVIHEVAAGIAVEYFNESAPEGRRAFAMVTAGPGITNIITALAGAFLDSRELLVIGGQVKSADLARGRMRQRGIQEIDGVALAKPVCVESVLMDDVVDEATFEGWIESGSHGRRGPVFVEICLDVQARSVDEAALSLPAPAAPKALPAVSEAGAAEIAALLAKAERPVILIGGGTSRIAVNEALPGLARLGVPLMTTWNGADRIDSSHPLYVGRPNTWGQRSSNIILQQADLVITLGTRLGLQQSGFNWQAFAPLAKVVQVEIDPAELEKGHPRVDLPIRADANQAIRMLGNLPGRDHAAWVAFCRMVRAEVPLCDPANETGEGFMCPYAFVQRLSAILTPADVVVPCSSGGANTVMMQAFDQKAGQVMFNSKSLASMGYGLSGAIGAAFAHPGRRTILTEGDGGFAQNLQEIGTAAINGLPVKMIVFSNEGYASIRMTQANYFNGRYVGCDKKTGLGLPDWEALFSAYGVPSITLHPGWETDPEIRRLLDAPGPAGFVLPLDPAQTYYPKITSRVTASGAMESNPLHLMSPELDPTLAAKVMPHLMEEAR